jgi:opacity protein-like surface antigen
LPQIGDNVAFYDQRSQVLALEGVFKPDQRWEYAGKLARREGEVRFGRLAGQWADSGATFVAGQVRYAFADRWQGLAEYRWLGVEDGGDRQGALIGVDRDLGNNFRVGVGYNFTDFSDDLTDFDYDHRGWFLNVVGWY